MTNLCRRRRDAAPVLMGEGGQPVNHCAAAAVADQCRRRRDAAGAAELLAPLSPADFRPTNATIPAPPVLLTLALLSPAECRPSRRRGGGASTLPVGILLLVRPFPFSFQPLAVVATSPGYSTNPKSSNES